MDIDKSRTLTLACLAAMVVSMLAAAALVIAFGLSPGDLRGPANVVSVPFVGSYIFVFLVANTAVATRGWARAALLASPAAFVASLAIVAGPHYGWYLMAGLRLAIPLVAVLVFAGPYGLIVVLFAAPVSAGVLAGVLTHVCARLLAGQPLLGETSRREALGHCAGFAVGAYIILLVTAVDDLGRALTSSHDDIADVVGLFATLWLVFFLAPASHLACLWVARERHGWTEGALHPRRLLIMALALFFAIGLARTGTLNEPARLLTWPLHDLYGQDHPWPQPGQPWFPRSARR